MLDALRDFGQGGAILLLGFATGAAWMMAVVAPNCSYDRLDAGRGNGSEGGDPGQSEGKNQGGDEPETEEV